MGRITIRSARRGCFRWLVLVGATLAAFGLAAASVAASPAPRFVIVRTPLAPLKTGGARAVMPSARGVLYLGNAWSRDGGSTWRRSHIGTTDIYSFGHRTRGLVYRLRGGDVARSTDFGVSWKRRGAVGAFADVNSLYVDAHDDSTLCVDFSDRVTVDPARLSTDGDATWRTSSFGCPTIARAGRHGDLVNLVPGEFLIRRSSDQGVTWTQALTDLPSTGPMQIVGDPSVTQGLYARGPTDVTWRYHSTDGGTHWPT